MLFRTLTADLTLTEAATWSALLGQHCWERLLHTEDTGLMASLESDLVFLSSFFPAVTVTPAWETQLLLIHLHHSLEVTAG